MVMDYPDYEGGKSKLYSGADWAAIDAYDVNLYSFLVNAGPGLFAAINYVVPAGLTLFVTNFGGECAANLIADADKNQMCHIRLYNVTTAEYLGEQGGNGGAYINLTKPAVILTGQNVQARIYNSSGHNCNLDLHMGGYQL